MITQADFVAECYSYYREMDYQPGNPEDGVWNKAHYPVPACKGGEDTILLLREHHAIQGVLQSGEYEHPCVGGWEGRYLPRYYIPAYRYWCGVRGTLGAGKGNNKTIYNWCATYTPTTSTPAYNDKRKRTPVDIHYPDGSVVTMPSIYRAAKTLGVNMIIIHTRLQYPLHVQQQRYWG